MKDDGKEGVLMRWRKLHVRVPTALVLAFLVLVLCIPAKTCRASALGESYPGAAFLMHLGDITETGSSSEYDLYDRWASVLGFPVFETPGNHESRWQDRFLENFRRRYGTGSYSFNYRGWHFVVLDTTYPGQTYGSLDPSVLIWLERDLESLPQGRPTVVFAHHPLVYEPRAFQDSDDLLLSLFARHPVKAVFCGHGHTFLHWKAQGIDFFMVGALMDGAYAVVEVGQDEMRVYAEKLDLEAAAATRNDVPVERTLLGSVSAEKSMPPENPLRLLRATTTEDGKELCVAFELTEEASLHYQMDGGPFVSLGTMPPGVQEVRLDISAHARGIHTLRLKASFREREGGPENRLQGAGFVPLRRPAAHPGSW